jgi:tRNA(adenine34) deaminase
MFFRESPADAKQNIFLRIPPGFAVRKAMDQDAIFMAAALDEARDAGSRDEVPIGAVIVRDGRIVARAGNRTREQSDPTAHAEILAIRDACKQDGVQRIPDCDLYVTLEPCALCAAAISFARIRRLVIGAIDPKGGAVLHGPQFYGQPTCHHRPAVTHGIEAEAGGKLLKDFFAGKRG